MSSTVARLPFAARPTGFGAIAEVFMPIRMRRQDDDCQKTQVFDSGGIIVATCADSSACYMNQKPLFGILCGSIKSLLCQEKGTLHDRA